MLYGIKSEFIRSLVYGLNTWTKALVSKSATANTRQNQNLQK